MRDHVVLNLLIELRKSDKCEVCLVFCRLFATSLLNSIIQDSIYHMTQRFKHLNLHVALLNSINDSGDLENAKR